MTDTCRHTCSYSPPPWHPEGSLRFPRAGGAMAPQVAPSRIEIKKSLFHPASSLIERHDVQCHGVFHASCQPMPPRRSFIHHLFKPGRESNPPSAVAEAGYLAACNSNHFSTRTSHRERTEERRRSAAVSASNWTSGRSRAPRKPLV